MKKNITLVLFIVIAAAILLMGVMENALSSLGGTPAVIAAYSVIGIILVVLYIKARKSAAEQKDEDIDNGKKNTDVH